jgi:hypothetical protein
MHALGELHMADSDEYELWNSLNPSIKTVLYQLERLRRNYYDCISSYDQISLYELSHSLRIWTDLKTVLPTIAPAFGTKRVFRSGTAARKLIKAVKGRNFVIAFMPGGVVSYASGGHMASAPDLPPDGDASLGAVTSLNADGSVTLSSYWYAESSLNDSQIQLLGRPEVSLYSYVDWMGAEAVRLWFPDETRDSGTLMISREVMINRIANTLDGSHPSAAPDPRTGRDKADPAIQKLLGYRLGGLPLPYFILLKIAKDILDNAGALLGIPKPQPQPAGSN